MNLEHQARLEAEVLLQKYRDRFGDISRIIEKAIAEQAKLISQHEGAGKRKTYSISANIH